MVDYQLFYMVLPNSLVVRGGHTAGTRSWKADKDLGVSLTLHFCLGPARLALGGLDARE